MDAPSSIEIPPPISSWLSFPYEEERMCVIRTTAIFLTLFVCATSFSSYDIPSNGLMDQIDDLSENIISAKKNNKDTNSIKYSISL